MKQLNRKFWKDDKLKEDIRRVLLNIAKKFQKEHYVPEELVSDITLTGSLANYTWTENSDVDLHIVLDFDAVEGDPEMVDQYYKSIKNVWNNNHDVMICGHEVEIYVQDVQEEHSSSGIFSLSKNKWLVKPSLKTSDVVDHVTVSRKANRLKQKIDGLGTTNSDAKQTLKKAEKLNKKIRTMRKEGLETGEYAVGNLVFKKLRDEKYIDKLHNIKRKAYDANLGHDKCSNEDYQNLVSAIFEATMDDISRRLPIFKTKYALSDQEIEQIIQADPTKGKYSEWLLRQYRRNNFSLDNVAEIKVLLTKYDQMKRRGFGQNSTWQDINNLMPFESNPPTPSLKSLVNAFENLGPRMTRSQKRSARQGQMVPSGSKMVLKNEDYLVLRIESYQAAQDLCSVSSWCVANEFPAKSYLNNGSLYLVYRKANDEKYERYALMHYVLDEETEGREDMEELFRLEAKNIRNRPLSVFETRFLVNMLEPVTQIPFEKMPEQAYKYAKDTGRRYYEAEPYILQLSDSTTIKYFMKVINQVGTWPEQYANPSTIDRHKGTATQRWPEAEEKLKNNYLMWKLYNLLLGREPQ
jgi:hypothetical protein